MPDIIHLLSDDIANKIAAGEVVVRPAAVVKELLENAIDAGADDIQLIIKDGGKSLIQVVDNGKGMSVTDARMAFERHATSKINHIDDLFSIQTMGFRGEALASIAAVSKVELKTKLHEHDLGTKIMIEGSDFIDQEACQSGPGTSISVKSLFYNVPARRKFLKSESVETRHVIEEFTRIALAWPGVKMSLFNNDKETYRLPAENLHRRIAHLFGKKQEERIVKVEEETDIVTVEGFIGKPEFAKKSKGEQYFFVNNRFIKSAYLNHAVYKAYDDFIEKSQYPLYVLKLTIDAEKIDVNVHPSKHEVKFEDERNIYAIVSASVRHALSKFSITPTLDFEADPAFNRHEFFQNPAQGKTLIENKVSKEQSTFLKREAGSAHQNKNWEELYTFSAQEEQKIEETAQQKSTSSQPAGQSFVQVNLRYILVQEENGFLLIDQRRAHQRIIYESILQSLQAKGFPSQKLLFPETIEVTAQQMENFNELKDQINQLGFELEEFGATTIIAHASPSEIQISNIQEFLESLLTELEHSDDYSKSHEMLARHLALYGAIRHGQKLNMEEMQAMFRQLMLCSQPNYGIRKDKTMLQYKFEDLQKAFHL